MKYSYIVEMHRRILHRGAIMALEFHVNIVETVGRDGGLWIVDGNIYHSLGRVLDGSNACFHGRVLDHDWKYMAGDGLIAMR